MKKDWKLFMERVPEWQEKNMERLLKEYVAYLESGEPASTKFWGLEKRIKDDKRTPGVQLRLEKQDMDSFALCNYLLEEALVVGVPGEAYGQGGQKCIRFSFATDLNSLLEAADRMKQALDRL